MNNSGGKSVMNREELDNRLIDMLFRAAGGISDNASKEKAEIKQLISECIDAIVPEKKEQRLPNSTTNDDAESHDRFYRNGGYNFAIETITKNKEKLIG